MKICIIYTFIMRYYFDQIKEDELTSEAWL
jgi:hypothetical protein